MHRIKGNIKSGSWVTFLLFFFQKIGFLQKAIRYFIATNFMLFHSFKFSNDATFLTLAMHIFRKKACVSEFIDQPEWFNNDTSCHLFVQCWCNANTIFPIRKILCFTFSLYSPDIYPNFNKFIFQQLPKGLAVCKTLHLKASLAQSKPKAITLDRNHLVAAESKRMINWWILWIQLLDLLTIFVCKVYF